MTKEEFNLSEKILNPSSMMSNPKVYNTLSVEDVKEFIKRLKEELHTFQESNDFHVELGNVVFIIDRLAGEKLI